MNVGDRELYIPIGRRPALLLEAPRCCWPRFLPPRLLLPRTPQHAVFSCMSADASLKCHACHARGHVPPEQPTVAKYKTVIWTIPGMC